MFLSLSLLIVDDIVAGRDVSRVPARGRVSAAVPVVPRGLLGAVRPPRPPLKQPALLLKQEVGSEGHRGVPHPRGWCAGSGRGWWAAAG